ncbi:MAG: hypothetical protein DI539_29045, partial [Flavobacterium psychrophilum]
MQKNRVKFDYSKLTDSELLAFSQAVVIAMTASASFFPTPNPTVTALNTAVVDYGTVLGIAATRDKTAITTKNEKKEKVVLMLADMAAYVNNIASGDEAKLSASGFDIVKQAETNPPIDIPKNMLVQAGLNSGEMVLSIDRVQGALSYNFQITPDPLTPESVWETQPTSRRKYLFQNLEVGKTYWFRVAAIGPREQVTYC